MLVVDIMVGRPIHRSKFGTTLCACKTILLSLPNFRISFVWKQTSNVTHLLVRVTLSYISRQIFYYIPSHI